METFDRRDFLKALGSGLAALSVPVKAGQERSQGHRPNLILIMADDLGYECLSCYGSLSYQTPRLDELARAGVRFTHCYSMPLCTPSRVQIMTGKYNFRNYTEFGALHPKEITFAHLLKRAGYSTCVVGKWQLAARNKGVGTYPEKAGFDEHCLWQVDQRESRYWDPLIQQNGVIRTDLKGRYGPDVFCEYLVDFVSRKRAGPFFVYYPMALVHSPFVPTPDSDAPSELKVAKAPSDPKYFADMVAYMDKIVGRIVDHLEDAGLRERTLLLFTGDNGTNRQITTRLRDRVVRGGKGTPTDAGTHVPLIASWPGTAATGLVCDDLIDFTDFLPTLLEAAGAKAPPDLTLDGRSFLPQIRGEHGQPREWIFCDYNPKWGRWKPARFVQDRRWKLYDDGRLFDLSTDLREQNPIAPGSENAEAAAARKRLQAMLQRMRQRTAHDP